MKQHPDTTNYIVLCRGKDDELYAVFTHGIDKLAALERVERTQNPYEIVAITTNGNGRPGEALIETNYMGVFREVSRSMFSVGDKPMGSLI